MHKQKNLIKNVFSLPMGDLRFSQETLALLINVSKRITVQIELIPPDVMN